jgi:hypothetical protein
MDDRISPIADATWPKLVLTSRLSAVSAAAWTAAASSVWLVAARRLGGLRTGADGAVTTTVDAIGS